GFTFVSPREPQPGVDGGSDQYLPPDARWGGTVPANVVEPAIDPIGIQPRERPAVPDKRAAGRTSGPGNHHVLHRFEKPVQRDSRRARRKRLAFASTRGRHVVGTGRAGWPGAQSLDSYFDDRDRFLSDDADPGGVGTGVRRSRPARLPGGRGGER